MPEKCVLSWDRKSAKSSRRKSEDRRGRRRPTSSSGATPRRSRSDDHRYKSSNEDLSHLSISPPCTCDLDSDAESHHHDLVREVREVPLGVAEGPETPSLFSPISQHSVRDGRTCWDQRSVVQDSISTIRTALRVHGKVSAASSGAYIVGADVKDIDEDRSFLATSPRSRSRPSTQERRRESSSGGQRSLSRPRSHSSGVHDRRILHYPHHFEDVCKLSGDGRHSRHGGGHQRCESLAEFKVRSKVKTKRVR